MGESKTVTICGGWLEDCGETAKSPYRFCQKHLEDFLDGDMLMYALRHQGEFDRFNTQDQHLANRRDID